MTDEWDRDLRQRYAAERLVASRGTIIAAGLVAIVGLPVWGVFDGIVAPEHAGQFLQIRLVATAINLCLFGLLFTPLGRRNPGFAGLAMLSVVDIAIALMIVRLDSGYAAYALGMSLPIYASALLIRWPVSFTVGSIVAGLLTLTAGWLISGGEASEIATVSFYLLTASVIALSGQVLRDRTSWAEFTARAELEAEQERSRELVDRLDRLSRQDSLTGLANRRAWDTAIERECQRAARSGGSLSILLCDLDGLKEINDGFGHAMGDVVIRQVGEVLAGRARGIDLVARLGGDEFGVLSPETDLLGAASLAEEMRRLIAHEDLGGSDLGGCTISIGCAEWEGGDDSVAALMMRADRRLYTAKARRNVVCAGDPPEQGSRAHRPV